MAKSNSHVLPAEQFLEDHTNWENLIKLVGEGNVSTGNDYAVVSYGGREYIMAEGDWVVQFPDKSLHFFTKPVFDELYENPMASPLTHTELATLSSGGLL